MSVPEVEAEIRCLTTEEGGRSGPVGNPCRGQFHYEGEDREASDGFQSFPDFPPGALIPLGQTVRAFVLFPEDRWNDYHSERIRVGTRFQVQGGLRVVGRGVIIRVTPQR